MTHEFYEDNETTKIPVSIVSGVCFILYGGTVFGLNRFLDAGFDTLVFEIIVVLGCLILCVPFALYVYSKHLSNTGIVSLGDRPISTDWVRYDEMENENDNTENAENFQNNE